MLNGGEGGDVVDFLRECIDEGLCDEFCEEIGFEAYECSDQENSEAAKLLIKLYLNGGEGLKERIKIQRKMNAEIEKKPEPVTQIKPFSTYNLSEEQISAIVDARGLPCAGGLEELIKREMLKGGRILHPVLGIV